MYRKPQVIKPDSTGIGLYMVKSILEGLGGSIHFELKQGGTTFFVDLFPVT